MSTRRVLIAVAALLITAVLPAAAQTPRKGGTLRMVAPYGSALSSLDIHSSQRAQDGIVAHLLHRSLYKWDTSANKPVLELAKDVAVSGNGLVLTYRLRDDVFFHNGRKMTADDLIWSFTRIMDGSKGFPGARFIRVIKGAVDVEKGQAKEISGLKKIDDNTLEMTITERVEPGYYFLTPTTSILPREEIEKGTFASQPVGLGPFKFVEHVPGSRLVAERFDKFYKAGQPWLDKIIVVIMGEAPARDLAFRNKEIDLSILGPAQYVAYRADPELAKGLVEVPEMFTRMMGMNPELKPFSDKRVRQAINHAIDADLIIKRLIKDKAYRAVSWLPIGSPGFDKARKPYAFDPAKAKQLLTEAGYPDGFEFEWTTSQNESWGLPVVEAVIPMLAKVGIKVRVKQIEAAVLSEVVPKGAYEAYIWSNATGPDPLAALKCYHSQTPPTACNYTRFKNAEFDKLVDEAAQTDDPARRAELMRKADGIVYEEAPIWFFNYNKAVLAHQPWVRGVQPNATELTWQYGEDLWVTDASPLAK